MGDGYNHRSWTVQSHPRLGLRLIVLVLVGVGLPGMATTNEPSLAVWDVAARMLVGGGYRDNVLLSSVQPESSPFVEATFDFSVIRLSDAGSTFSVFLLGEFRRYLENIEVEGQPFELEQLTYLTTEWRRALDDQNTLGAAFEYLYQHQVIDASETEADVSRVLIRGHSLSVQPFWEHALAKDWTFTLEGTAERQIYESELDDFWQGSTRVKLSRAYGHRSEAGLFYELRHRFYDTREQYTTAGVPEAGTSLVYRSHELGAEWRHYWDSNRRWRTVVKAGYLRSEDNGSGYFDYDRVQLSGKVRCRDAGWEISAAARAGWYYYDVQQVAGDNRERSFYALDGRLERWLTRHWLVYIAASREWNLSNDPLEEYNDWFASAGFGADF